MSDITYDWMPCEAHTTTERPTVQMVRTGQPYRREDEFRAALNGYMIDYRKHHAMIANKARATHNTDFGFIRRFCDLRGHKI